jgi:hypothetical protein
MPHVSRCSLRLAATLGVGAAIAAAALSHGIAQPAPNLMPGLRAALDDADPARPELAKRPKREGDTRRPGDPPVYGIPSGAGKTGFSAAGRKTKAKKKATAKAGAGEPLPLAGAVPVQAAPPPLTPPPDTSRRRAVVRARVTPAPTGANASAMPDTAPATPSTAGPPPPATGDAQPAAPLPYTLPPRRRPTPELDPFEQVGVRAGAFLVKPAIELIEGYDSNPARVLGGKGSWFTTIAPELSVRSDWQRHEVAAVIRGSYTAYEALASQDRPTLDARITGRIDVTERTRIDLEGRYLLATDYAGSPDVPAGVRKLPVFTDLGASAGVTHRWNRFELTAKGLVDRVEYDDAKLVNGAVLSQKWRDYTQYGSLLRGSYEVTPGFKPFVEVNADTRTRDVAVDPAGERRDSHGFSVKAGSTFELTRLVTGKIAVGYITRTYKDPNLPDLHGLLVDASLVWAATGLTTVSFNAKTTADETTLAGVSGVLRHNLALQVDHAFRRWLIGSLRFAYGLDDYQGSLREDKRYVASAALVYKLSRAWQLKGELREEWLRSNTAGADYSATVGLLGLRWQP